MSQFNDDVPMEAGKPRLMKGPKPNCVREEIPPVPYCPTNVNVAELGALYLALKKAERAFWKAKTEYEVAKMARDEAKARVDQMADQLV